MYGFYRAPIEDEYLFNAENQFRNACYHSGINIFDYSSDLEEKSLYEYDQNNYFDSEYNIKNNTILYVVVRI